MSEAALSKLIADCVNKCLREEFAKCYDLPSLIRLFDQLALFTTMLAREHAK